MVNFIRKRALSGEFLSGAWCNLGSSISVEMAALSGFDWCLIDLEHGSGGYESLVHQVQALHGRATAPIVRIAWNEPARFKRVLDLGISGVMVPYVSNAEEAQAVARAMRYPPEGIRGVAYLNLATGFGKYFDEYFKKANDNLLTIVQIETKEGAENAEEIAAVEGVDILFVGPMDLSVNMGIPQQFDHPKLKDTLSKIVEATRSQGKAAGILLGREELLEDIADRGFTFVALTPDCGMVAKGMNHNLEILNKYKN